MRSTARARRPVYALLRVDSSSTIPAVASYTMVAAKGVYVFRRGDEQRPRTSDHNLLRLARDDQ